MAAADNGSVLMIQNSKGRSFGFLNWKERAFLVCYTSLELDYKFHSPINCFLTKVSTFIYLLA